MMTSIALILAFVAPTALAIALVLLVDFAGRDRMKHRLRWGYPVISDRRDSP